MTEAEKGQGAELPSSYRFDAEVEDLAVKRIIEGMNAVKVKRVGHRKYEEYPDYVQRERNARLVLEHNWGKPAATVNVNQSGGKETKQKSPAQLIADLQGNLPLLQRVLQNAVDAARTIDITPESAQIGQGPDWESVGLGQKSPKNREKEKGV